MNLFFDEESQKILVDAKKEMYALRHPYVGSEHLFLAILKHKDLDITKFLIEYGINYDRFKEELINVIGVGSKCNNWFLFTPLLKRILNNATYSSKDENKCVSPSNLLESILQEGDGVANRILLGMNVDLELLYDKFLTNNYILTGSKKKLLLDSFSVNMNREASDGKYDPVVGRDNQIDRIIQILLRKNKNNPVLVGEAGVGKTAIVEEIARRINNNDVPIKLKNKIIYNLSMSNLISGTKYRGEFEERLTKMINEIRENPNIILFIDEIHTLVGAGGAEGAIDASNILKPFLARGDIKVIGATTLDEYSKFIEKDKALARRFQKVLIEEPSTSEVRDILCKLVPIYEKFHLVTLDGSLIDLMIKLSNRCVTRGRQPDKTIDLLDEVCCYASINHNENNSVLSKYEKDIKEVEAQKNEEILNHNFKKALIFRKKEYKLKDEYNRILLDNNINNSYVKVTEEDFYKVLYNKTNIPLGRMFNDKLCKFKLQLQKEMIGQNNVIDDLIKYLSKIDFINEKVVNNYLLVGKNGVGKTFFVEKFTESIFNKNNLIKLNMSEYYGSHSVSKIIGAAPGYIGYEDRGCFLDKIKDRSFSVVLLENIDKCNNNVLELFKCAFTDGYFTSSKGEIVGINNCIFFMTSTSKKCSLGFIGNDKFDNKLCNINSTIIEFNDISEKDVDKYLLNKIKCLGFDEVPDKNEFIKRIKLESNFNDFGFEKIDGLFEKYFSLMSVN